MMVMKEAQMDVAACSLWTHQMPGTDLETHVYVLMRMCKEEVNRPQFENQSLHRPPHELSKPPESLRNRWCWLLCVSRRTELGETLSLTQCCSVHRYWKLRILKVWYNYKIRHYWFAARCCLSSMYLKLENIYQICKWCKISISHI